jgi:pSer/pThr/pTyr-binding forkhead associated (FHA) protein
MTICENCGTDFAGTGRLCPECEETTTAPTTSFAPVGAPRIQAPVVIDASSDICLCVVKGPQVGECFYLEGDHITIGRDPKAQLFLNDLTVSREHATIDRRGTEVILHDAASLNGTYLNGIIVDEAKLKNGDLLQIGTFQLAFRASATTK